MTARPVSTLDTTQHPAPTRVERLQDGTLLLIVLLVGLMAGAASFNHVHDWTLANSPDGTADWFGWANAVISELIPTASLIEIGRRRRRHRTRAKIGYPMVLLVAAVSVSLTAQLAVAQPSVFGWMVSALPALAFFALSKLVFTATASPRPTHSVTAEMPATSPAPSTDTAQAKVRPAAATPKTRATPVKKATPAKKTPARTSAKKTPAPAPAEPVTAQPATVDTTPVALADRRFPDLLLSNARTIAASHRDEHGEDINPNQMAVRLKVPTLIATDILTQLATKPPASANTAPHNGSTVGVSA